MMTRWKAAGIHLLISTCIALIAGALLLGLWYPPAYFHAAGADELIVLLIGVDLALGPLLTLIVFRVGKRGLKFDLSVIGILQLGALVYGMTVVSQSRPIFLAATVDRFVLVSANEITDSDLAQGREPQFRTRSWTGPRLVAVEMPTDVKERNDLIFSALGGRDAQNLPKYYRDYSQTGKQLLARAKPISALLALNPQNKEIIDKALDKVHQTEQSVVWVPIEGRKSDLVMVLRSADSLPLLSLALDPW
jgi:hypothetical protein